VATRAELQRAGQKQLKLKLKLEKKLDRKMRRFFKGQNKLFLTLQNSGVTLDAALLEPELQQVLTDHYKDTAAAFQPATLDQINEVLVDAGEPELELSDPALLAALLFFISRAVKESAGAITGTSNNEIAKALAGADGDAKAAHRTLKTRVIPRSRTVATTETQKAAEGSKQLVAEEAGTMAAGAAGVALLLHTTKTWMTRMDARVRPDHVSAEFQEVPLLDPYIVGGEYLMYPGDMGLGASLWNVVNCRCSSIQETRIL